MITDNGGQQYVNNNRGFINLQALTGSGESTQFVDEVVGVLLGIEPRDGFYTINDRRTGQPIQRPNSWIGHWMTETGEKLMSWPTYTNEQGATCPWSRFDPRINLAACSANQVALHMWRDDRNFYHLEIVEQQQTTGINPLPMTAPWQA